MVYRLILSYRGDGFAGWQRQPNALAVQQVVEEAIWALTGEEVALVGAGRTDAGVHARGQVAHLSLSREWPATALVHGVNHHLPERIRILEAGRMAEGFHARKCALAKEYRYRLSRAPVVSPLDAPFVWQVDPGLEVAAMRAAASTLPGRHDFSAFALAGGAHNDPRRTILEAEWLEAGLELTLRVVGDGFLRGMVRSLVGTLVEVGRGKRAADAFGALLAGGDRGAAGPTAPPQGLVLERVDYGGEWGWLEDG
jgi:tRNA pseudouridine38-40 synthase